MTFHQGMVEGKAFSVYMRKKTAREDSRAPRESPRLNMASRMDRAMRGWGSREEDPKRRQKRPRERGPREWRLKWRVI